MNEIKTLKDQKDQIMQDMIGKKKNQMEEVRVKEIKFI
jgi:hypothetical protein